MTIIIIVRFNHDVMTLTITSRVDRDGEAEVCSERDTHHPVAALAWLTIIIILVEIFMEMMKTMVMKTKDERRWRK